jgi:hypothetical protein
MVINRFVGDRWVVFLSPSFRASHLSRSFLGYSSVHIRPVANVHTRDSARAEVSLGSKHA